MFSLIIDAYNEYTTPIVNTQWSLQDNDYPFVLQQEDLLRKTQNTIPNKQAIPIFSQHLNIM